MKVYLNTYRTFTQKKKVYELIDKKDTQWIIYQNNEPKFYVDLFDLTTESNAMMNSLVLCSKRTLDEVLEILNRKNNIKLWRSLKKVVGFTKVVIERDLATKLPASPVVRVQHCRGSSSTRLKNQ